MAILQTKGALEVMVYDNTNHTVTNDGGGNPAALIPTAAGLAQATPKQTIRVGA